VQEKKKEQDRTLILVELIEKVIDMNNFAKEAGINNPEIAR